ncbi:type I DNA topoisomerase [Candidatus Parcubacteria bacterium]|nr:type I DNA topoisomerase [Candidatus Parcubacteria bacterium]
MSKNVVIVESPAKAKTIEKFLGKDFKVVASFGHVRDLPKKGVSVDIEHGFTPTYEISPDKKKHVAELKRLAKTADTVWLASDEDREGEAIAWHLVEALKLKDANTKRIVFHEITKPAIERAVKNPRGVDKNLVDAQQARRVLDRLVGYGLSPVLWKKVRTGLSAGRVQSVAVRLIVEREREIENFSATAKFKLTAEFTLAGGKVLKAELPKKFDSEPEARRFLESLKGAAYQVADLVTKPAKKSPPPPFTTSTLQQEASRKLGFSVKQTMVVAQKLYEAGHISYMRTDSVNLSDTAVAAAAKQITRFYGAEFAQTRRYATKSAGAQEAHEAIRPTDFSRMTAGADSGQQRLYQLIWQRTIASQMADARLEKTEAAIAISTRPETLVASGEVVRFEGFLKVYTESSDRDDRDSDSSKILPPLAAGQKLDPIALRATQVYDRPKPRYTEASLVKKLEEMGIGRPSTYAPTISTIQDRGYVEKGDLEGHERPVSLLTLKDDQLTSEQTTEITGAERAKLFPTAIGGVVTDFLVKHFPDIVDYQFTAKVEAEFDEIARGQQPWNSMISDFYGPFRQTVAASENVSRQEASQARELGSDPATGKPVIARMGRYGPMLQIGQAEDEEKPRFAPLPAGRKITDVTLAEALELFKLPRSLGTTPEGEEITANFGRFGPYIKFGGLYASITPDDPFSITRERALELVAAKKTADAQKYIRTFDGSPVKVVNGRFGPFITNGTKNAKIPAGQDPARLTQSECEALLAAAPTKKKRKRIVKKA